MKRLIGIVMLAAIAYPCLGGEPTQPTKEPESVVGQTPAELTREQAEAAMAGITAIYQETTSPTFIADNGKACSEDDCQKLKTCSKKVSNGTLNGSCFLGQVVTPSHEQ